MPQQNDVNAEMQQVSAYPTKQEMHQKDVALMEEQDCGCTSKQCTDTQSKQE
ncbi:hypothetical protein [Brevibacillus choshinensis]|uniref:Uncharacterized protein n=1 Tax=Brevibacillus choshinensis TaxID=54911 RepID=A0ABX7FX65_BRECH|nr:hypothetical protein [Brevibacillus choshinensis]QRG70390.1 hypothetical protein JNE38_15530 [Brevibacillus choshinensis]